MCSVAHYDPLGQDVPKVDGMKHTYLTQSRMHFVRALFLYLLDLVEAGRYEELQDRYGLTPEGIDTLRRLGHRGLRYIDGATARLLTLQVDQAWFQRIFAVAARRLDEQEEMEALLRAGASFTMLRALYGSLSRRRLLRLRRVANSEGVRRGRPMHRQPELLEAVAPPLNALVAQRNGDPRELKPADYLSLHAATGVPAYVLWSIVQDREACPWLHQRPNDAASPARE